MKKHDFLNIKVLLVSRVCKNVNANKSLIIFNASRTNSILFNLKAVWIKRQGMHVPSSLIIKAEGSDDAFHFPSRVPCGSFHILWFLSCASSLHGVS